MSSFRSIVDGGADSDMIYYNAIITSTRTADVGNILPPATIRFNETRDAPIVRDASQYYFSIIRFAMNGIGKNLPLFIPLIQTNGYTFQNQSDPNLTIYYVSIAYQQTWNYTDINGVAQTRTFTITPPSVPIEYISETQNNVSAPAPSPPATGFTKQDLSTRYYWVYTYKHWAKLVNNSLIVATNVIFDLFQDAWTNDPNIDQVASPFPFADPEAWASFVAPPFVKYDEESQLFSIYADTRNFNISGQVTGVATSPYPPYEVPEGTQQSVPLFTPTAFAANDPPSPASQPYFRLFFNDNLFGLMSNFNNTYLGVNGNGILYWPLSTTPIPIEQAPQPSTVLKWLYTNEILFENQLYTNILNNNPTLQNMNALPPPNYNPYFLIPADNQNLYWISKQDYSSTGSLWSPVSSIVFTSALLPLKKEYTATPITLDNTNATKSTNSPSAFEPIITDIVIDQAVEKAQGWRDFFLYEPTAEYKLTSMAASHEEIRNIDIQVFWKYRLTGELIPLSMFNTSDVSIKIMFRKIDFRS